VDVARALADDAKPTLASRAVRRRVGPAEAVAETEVRALMDAALALMRDTSSARPPRVADIVAAAGLSNDAFYRYFASKDDLVAAIVDDGARRLVDHVRHQIEKSSDPRRALRAAVAAIMKQAADPDVAATTRAVMGNATRPIGTSPHGSTQLVDGLAAVFAAPLRELGSTDPARHARQFAAAAVAGMQYFLWHPQPPPRDEVDVLLSLLLDGIS
jgi:AcrR family transcriptional regulator